MTLKNVHPLLSGELLLALDHLGHGDALVLVDRNYPAYTSGAPVVRLDCHSREAAEAILSVLPLDTTEAPMLVMEAPSQPDRFAHTMRDVGAIARRIEGRDIEIVQLERHAFYNRAQSARLVVLTRESEPYSDLIWIKGVVA